jgi:hypothetical protein
MTDWTEEASERKRRIGPFENGENNHSSKNLSKANFRHTKPGQRITESEQSLLGDSSFIEIATTEQEKAVSNENQKTPFASEVATNKLMVFDVQKALYKRIISYTGPQKNDKRAQKGIEAVWAAIKPGYKYDNDNQINAIEALAKKNKITEDAFKKAVTRLNEQSALNEKMSFGIRGNFLLLMDVFRILGIDKFSDIFENTNYDNNTAGVIFDIQNSTDKIQEKLDELSEKIDMGMKKRTRFTELKVCHDSEFFFQRINEIFKAKNDSYAFPSEPSKFQYVFKNPIYEYITQTPKECHIPLYIFNLLFDFREYFAQDKRLYRFYKNFSCIDFVVHNTNYGNTIWFVFWPLYAMYFYLLINRKFLSIMIKKDNIFYMKNISVKFDKEMDSLLQKGGGKIGICLYDINKEIQISLDEIIKRVEIFSNDYKNEPALWNRMKEFWVDWNERILTVFNEFINSFYDIYFNSTYTSHEEFRNLLKKTKNIGALYDKMALGILNGFAITERMFTNITQCRESIDDLKMEIPRDKRK